MARSSTTGETDLPDSTKERKRSAAARPAAGVSRNREKPVDMGHALIEAYQTNERINQVLLDAIDPKIWRAMPPCSKRRNIATTFAHIHNVRCMRLAMSVRDEEPPARLDRAEVTPAEAREALEKSAGAMVRLVATLEGSDPATLEKFRREYEALAEEYFEDNLVRQDYLITCATKV